MLEKKFKKQFKVEETSVRDEYLVSSDILADTQKALYQFFLAENVFPEKIDIYQPNLEEIFTEVVL